MSTASPRCWRVTDEGESTRVRFRAPEALARFVAPKGSVALNGTSLTVNEVEGREFGVNLIPHTKAVTTWGGVRPAMWSTSRSTRWPATSPG